MSNEKIRVKELATELNTPTKDVLSVAKDLGIVAAKAVNSSLSDAEAAKLRNHFNPATDKNNVIVRKRRVEPQQAGGEQAEPASLVDVKGSSSADDVEAAIKTERAPKAQKAKKPEPVAARIITPVAKEQPAQKIPEVTLHAPKAEVVQEVVAVQEIVPAPAMETTTKLVAPKVAEAKAPDHTEKPNRQAPAQKAKKPEPVAPTFAKVIRPAVFSAEPERDSSGEAISSAPVLAPRSEDTDRRDARADGNRSDQAGDSGSVRVISRPTEQVRTPRPAGGDGRDNRPPRPADGNRPYPPRPADGNRPNYNQGAPRPADGTRPYPPRDGGAPRPADGTRPYPPRDGGAPRPPRPADGTRPYPPRDGGAPRPADGTRPYPPRDGAPRPAGGAPRPAGGAPRPAGGAPRPAGGGFTPPAIGADNEQGRKKRQKGRRTVDFANSNTRSDSDDAGWSKSTRRKSRKPREVAPLGGTQPVKASKRVIKMDEFIRVADLAHQLAVKSGEVIKVLFGLGVMATINQSLDFDTTVLVAQEFGYEVEKSGFFEEEILSSQQEVDKEEDLVIRPPVVTIMGHVDHGKTSLLDAIRTTSVVSGEAGGITQHIGAYHVKTPKGEIAFLDTPGHEAFTAMRSRGAEVTDIVVLVVAADDGVMEQTKEAISHAKAAKVPIMVAVNKMDKPEANPDRVKRELAEQGLVAEDWGGDTTFSYVSAKTRDGLDELLELLALQAEILELKANPNKPATGHVIEAKLDKGRGALGTVLIQQGTLRLGDVFVCGVHAGRVRAMFNDQGKKVKEAGPSMPVEVQGFEGVPQAGDTFVSIADEKTARRIASARAIKQRERDLAKESKVTLETFLARKSDDVETIVLNLVVKADVQGSLEAINEALLKMSTEKVRINLIHGGTGAISESDVLLSAASNAIIIGFNVRPTSKGKELAESEKVDMRFYDIIYKLVEEIKSAMEGMLAPVSKEVFLGTAEVRETFSVPKIGLIAGSHVSEGKMLRNALARLLRDGVVIYSGKLSSLRRFKDDMREVAKGYECGIGLENYSDIKVGDVIEAYEIVEEAAKL